MHLLIPRQGSSPDSQSPNNPVTAENQQTSTSSGTSHGGGGMSPVGVAMLVLFILLLTGIVAYVLYSQLRARRLGLPAPNWRSYVPFLNNSRSRSSRPSTGPLGWIKSKTTGGGGGGGGFSLAGPTGYTGASVRSERTRAQFGQLKQDDDEAWDARGYREYDIDDVQRGRSAPIPNGYEEVGVYGNTGLGPVSENGHVEEPQRGRSREPPYPAPGPAPPKRFSKPQPRSSMDSFTGVSVKGGRASLDGERRSVFREAM